MTFGERLKNARKKKGLTQKELAMMICVKNNSISNWEHDQNLPSASNVFSLTRALGISITDLIGRYELTEVEAIADKPFSERSRLEKLVYDIFNEYSYDIGYGFGYKLRANGKDSGDSIVDFTGVLDCFLSDAPIDSSFSDPHIAGQLLAELRGIMSDYNSLTDEGKQFVKQSVKTALAAYSKRDKEGE